MSFKQSTGFFLISLIVLIIAMAGCGGGGGGGGTTADPPITPDPVVTPAGQISIYNQSPTFRNAFTTSSSPVTISGMGNGAIDAITWKNLTTGNSGKGAGTLSWSVSIPLQEGDNELEISAVPQAAGSAVTDGSITINLTVTYNTSVNFTSLVQLTPDTGLAGETYGQVYVRVGIDKTNLNDSTVKVYNVNDFGDKVGDALATLTDDGDLANGDEIEGDGIYSGKLVLTPPEAGPINMRIFASDTAGTESKTATFAFKVFNKPTAQQLSQQAENNEAAADKFNELVIGKMDSLGLSKTEAAEASLDEMVAYLKQLGGVVDAGLGGYGIWWLNDAGMFMVLSSTYFEDEKEAYLAHDSSQRRPNETTFFGDQTDLTGYDEKSTRVEYLPTGKAIAEHAAAADGSNSHRGLTLQADDEKYNIGSFAALHTMPYQHTVPWYKTKYPGGWYSIVEKSKCPAFTTTVLLNELHDPMTDAATEPVPLSVWKTLSKYGLIASATHGTTLHVIKEAIETKYPYIKDIDWLFPWHNQRPVLSTNIIVDWSFEGLGPYFTDILAGRIMLSPRSGDKVKLFITPEFISHYNETFPNSIWINIACMSAFNDALGAAFIAKGGGAYYGYTDNVSASYAHNTEKEILKQLVQENKNVKEAFDAAVAAHGPDDGRPGKAALTLIGEHKTKVGASDLKNPSFEEPEGMGSLNGWIRNGDARAIRVLGGDFPTDGDTMAIISTGLGFTTSLGSISQSFCLPDNAHQLIFDWNFFSEEFKRYCNTAYDDTFLVSIMDIEEGVETVLFKTSVNALCGACQGTNLNSPACIDLPLLKANIGFDRGDVWLTGWNRTETVNISAYQGKAVEIMFYVTDRGDSIFDTAMLVDNIRVTTFP